MKTFDDIAIHLDKLDTLMYATESAMLEAASGEELTESTKRLHNLIYIVWDEIKSVSSEISDLSHHIKVCEAVFAINRCAELHEERDALQREVTRLHQIQSSK